MKAHNENNKITLEILFYYIVAIQKRKKHKIKKYTIIIYNNRNYIKQSHTTPHNDTNENPPHRRNIKTKNPPNSTEPHPLPKKKFLGT